MCWVIIFPQVVYFNLILAQCGDSMLLEGIEINRCDSLVVSLADDKALTQSLSRITLHQVILCCDQQVTVRTRSPRQRIHRLLHFLELVALFINRFWVVGLDQPALLILLQNRERMVLIFFLLLPPIQIPHKQTRLVLVVLDLIACSQQVLLNGVACNHITRYLDLIEVAQAMR